jgi:hypothetical protein
MMMMLPSCASVSLPHLRTDETPLGSEPVVLRSAGKVFVERAFWDGDRLTAQVKQERFCQSAMRHTARYQNVEERTSHLVAFDIVLGALLVGGGGALLGVTPFIPNQTVSQSADGSGPLTTQDLSLIGGIGIAAAGIGILSYGIAKGIKSRDRLSGAPWVASDDRELGQRRPCEPGPAPLGEVRLAFGDRPWRSTPVADGKVSLDLAELGADLCDNEALIGVPLSVSYVNGPGTPLPIASRDLDDCIRAKVANRLLVKTREEVQAIEATFADGKGDLYATQRLLAGTGPTRTCLLDARRCPLGMTQESVASALHPFGDRLAGELRRTRLAVEAATAQLRHRLSEANEEAARAAVATAQEQRRTFCDHPIVAEARGECETLSGAVEIARQAVADNEAMLRHLRSEHAAARWRQHFGLCRKVSAAIAQMRSVSRCDVHCQLIVSRVKAERDALEQVEIQGELEAEVQEKLQIECQRAGCPSCP